MDISTVLLHLKGYESIFLHNIFEADILEFPFFCNLSN